MKAEKNCKAMLMLKALSSQLQNLVTLTLVLIRTTVIGGLHGINSIGLSLFEALILSPTLASKLVVPSRVELLP